MDLKTVIIIVGCSIGILAVFALIIIAGISSDKKNKRKAEKQKEAEERLEKEPEYSECRARLVHMRCGVDVRGTKRVFVTQKYFIAFELEDGKNSEFQVDEGIYSLLEEGMTGTLVTVEGNFFGFEADN